MMVVGSRTSLSQTVFDIFDELLVAIYEVCLLRPPPKPMLENFYVVFGL